MPGSAGRDTEETDDDSAGNDRPDHRFDGDGLPAVSLYVAVDADGSVCTPG
jgi:hypothetical protein